MTTNVHHPGVFLRFFFTAVLLLCLNACAPVTDAPVIKIIATDPGTETILGAQQRFHIRFSVTSKAPLVVTLDPYFQKEPLSANLGTSAPIALPTGGGTAVAHLFFWGDYATRVDEIRLIARAPKQSAVQVQLALPVKLSWVARDVPPRDAAAWVGESQMPNGALSALDERSQWLVFGTVIVAIAVGGFGSRWLRKRWRTRRSGE